MAEAPVDERVLECSAVSPRYGSLVVARDVELVVGRGEVVALLGPNGAGKTSTVEYLAGRVGGTGTVTLDGTRIDGMATHRRIRAGLSLVPEDRGLFGDLTVEENLTLALFLAESGTASLDVAYDLFPRLRNRRRQLAGTLSGGEQQMLAIGRAIVPGPQLLILDEPTQGLAPVILDDIAVAIEELKRRGLSMLLVEQSVGFSAQLSDRYHVLSGGQLVATGGAEDLSNPEALFERYLAN